MAATNGAPVRVHIGMAMLEQLAELDARDLSPDTAEEILAERFGHPHQQRVKLLSEKARRGTLSPDEDEELDEYIHVGNLLAILQSKARQALKRAGRP
jgi:hypothetical protein